MKCLERNRLKCLESSRLKCLESKVVSVLVMERTVPDAVGLKKHQFDAKRSSGLILIEVAV